MYCFQAKSIGLGYESFIWLNDPLAGITILSYVILHEDRAHLYRIKDELSKEYGLTFPKEPINCFEIVSSLKHIFSLQNYQSCAGRNGNITVYCT